jgi:hypothetical protein
MGLRSEFVMLDFKDLNGRVWPAVRDWLAWGQVAGWWAEALRRAGCHGPEPADRDAWPAMLRPPMIQPPRLYPRLLPLPDRELDESTRGAIEVAVGTAIVGEGLRWGGINWLAGDVEDRLPAGTRVLAVLDELNNGWKHVRAGVEGVRGVLDPVEVVALDGELVALGSHPFLGSVAQIRDATDRFERWDSAHSLFCLHAMLRVAGERGLGLLNGRGLRIAAVVESVG